MNRCTELGNWPPVLRVGRAGPVMVSVFSGALTPELFDALEATLAREVEANPGKLMGLTVLEEVLTPTKEILERSRRLSERLDPQLKATAIAITKGGLSAVMARSFMAAFALINPPKTPTRTFRSVAEAMVWLASIAAPNDPVSPEIIDAVVKFAAPAHPRP